MSTSTPNPPKTENEAEAAAVTTTTTTKVSTESNQKKRPATAPLTEEGEKPQKRFYRQRAHCNPLSHNDAFEYPLRPEVMDWTTDFYPGMPPGTVPNVLDIGCGFGGLTLALAKLLPDKVILGMEIRAKVRLNLSQCI